VPVSEDSHEYEAFLLIFPVAITRGPELAPANGGLPTDRQIGGVIVRGCRGFVGPVPLPLWMSIAIRL
jgi:hypothetical protein